MTVCSMILHLFLFKVVIAHMSLCSSIITFNLSFRKVLMMHKCASSLQLDLFCQSFT